MSVSLTPVRGQAADGSAVPMLSTAPQYPSVASAPTTASSPAAMAAWRRFEQCLAANGLTFADVKDADAGARLEMIASVGGASLVFGGGGSEGPAKAEEEAGGATVLSNAVKTALEAPPALSGVEMALVSSRWNAMVPTAATGASIPQAASGASGGSGEGSLHPYRAPVQNTVPFLDPTHGRSLLHRGTTDLLDDMRRQLSAGHSAPALAIASELLHRDPIPMLRLLHEFAPHISMVNLQEILGVRAAASAEGYDEEALISEFGAQQMGQGLAGDVGVFGNPNSGYRNAAGLPLTGSAGPAMGVSGAVFGSSASSPLRRGVPTLNDIPLRVGAVLTAGALSAQFGVGFRATFSGSGRTLQLPHCVQEGDLITVLKSSEVIR